MKKKKSDSLFPRVVFQDEVILVLDKPAGMVTTRAESVREETLEDWLRENFRYPLVCSKKDHAGLAHRLDKETSGLVLAGKTKEALKELRAQFKERRVEKRYLALVTGKLFSQKASIDLPVGRGGFNRKKFTVTPEGRPARTDYERKELYRDKEGRIYSFLELQPKTGRTHQIRVHLKMLNHPIVADGKYGGRKTATEQRSWCPRHFLHAFRISFCHPGSGEKVNFISPLPDDLRLCLASLEAED